jgi:hypothetical protein
MTRDGGRGSGILRYMIASVEILICLVAIAASVKWTATEYIRVRRNRQLSEALRLAVSELA